MQAIQFSRDECVATIVLDRAQARNALSATMVDELDQVLFEIGPAEAQALGIVLEVTKPEALLPRARALAGALAQASPVALALTKDALNASLGSSLDSMLELEAAAQAVAGTSAFAREAFRPFAAKEAGQFQWPAASATTAS